VDVEPALSRFDGTERVVHWVNAVLVGVLVATGAVLYLGELSALVGRRELLRDVHVASGLALPFPLLLALPGRRGRRLRADLGALNRFGPDDGRWLCSRGRDRSVRLGKFNPGQKLNAAFVAGAGTVLFGTGLIMRFFGPFPLDWRTGATFVHDWTALGLGLAVTGHVGLALSDPDALRSMVKGSVPASWARRHRTRWYEEMVRAAAGTTSPGPSPPPAG
jgi:formate dehydrogenase subunit gamma